MRITQYHGLEVLHMIFTENKEAHTVAVYDIKTSDGKTVRVCIGDEAYCDASPEEIERRRAYARQVAWNIELAATKRRSEMSAPAAG